MLVQDFAIKSSSTDKLRTFPPSATTNLWLLVPCRLFHYGLGNRKEQPIYVHHASKPLERSKGPGPHRVRTHGCHHRDRRRRVPAAHDHAVGKRYLLEDQQ